MFSLSERSPGVKCRRKSKKNTRTDSWMPITQIEVTTPALGQKNKTTWTNAIPHFLVKNKPSIHLEQNGLNQPIQTATKQRVHQSRLNAEVSCGHHMVRETVSSSCYVFLPRFSHFLKFGSIWAIISDIRLNLIFQVQSHLLHMFYCVTRNTLPEMYNVFLLVWPQFPNYTLDVWLCIVTHCNFVQL